MSSAKSIPLLSDGRRLHGRERAFKRVIRAVGRDHPQAVVLVTGPSGVGRSAFLDAVGAAFGQHRNVVTVHGRAELSAVPLGALAPALATLPPGDPGVSPLVAFHRSLARGGVLLLVDDAELLDPASLCVIEQAARDGVAAMVVGLLSRAPVGGAASGAHRLAQLATEVVELPPLTVLESHALLKDKLGTSVGPQAADEMVRLAAGSTRTLAELAEAAVGSCLAEATGPWQECWPYITEGLVRSLPADPLAADPLVADLLALIAVTGETPVEQAGTSGCSERATALAESQRYVTTRRHDGRVWVRLAHPLFAPVVLSGMSELSRSGFCAAGADMLDGYPEFRVRRSLLQLAAGQRVSPALLLDLARTELGAQRYATAITLGQQAVAGGGDDLALRAIGEFVQAQALSQIGRTAEASQHFAAAWAALERSDSGATAGVLDEDFVARLAQAEGNHLAIRMLRPELAVERLERVLGRFEDTAARGRIESDLLRWRLMSGRDSTLELDSLAALGEVETAADLNLLIVTASLQTQGGNLTLAGEAVERGLQVCDRFRDELPNARDLLQLSEVLVLSFTGRFGQARAAARANLAAAEAANPSARGIWKFVLAMIELHTGSPARAWKHISEGRRDLVWRDVAGLLPTADALSAAIAARTGRFAIARSWLDQLTPAEVRDPKVELYASLARAWVSAASGRPGFAIRSLGPALHKASDGGFRYLAALVAYEAIRIEPVVGATVMLPHLIAARSAFPICESHARAVIGRHDVLPVAEQLAESGLLGPAIDAARWVAENAGADVVRASRAHRLADSWTVRTGVSIAPSRRQAHPRVTPLTDREWQLASGAAAHRTSAELAAEYGISVRTVDNHLARIYRKLGISGRRELSAELGELRLDSPYEEYSAGAGS